MVKNHHASGFEHKRRGSGLPSGFRLQKARRGPQRRRWVLVRAAALLCGSAAQGAVAGGESGVAYANGRRHYEGARARYGGCGHTLHCQLPAGAGAGALTVAGMLRGAVLYGGFECYGGFCTTP